MKRIRLGDKSGYCFLIVVISILFLIVIIATAIKQSIYNAIIDIIALIVLYCLFLLSTAFIEDWTWYMELETDTIKLKMPFKTIREYNKQELNIRYATKSYWFRGVPSLYPCLIIGILCPNKIWFERRSRKDVFDNYFLVVLDSKKKLDAILAYFNQKIKLPEKEDWEDFNEQWKKRKVRAVWTSVQEYYDLIERYNQTKD